MKEKEELSEIQLKEVKRKNINYVTEIEFLEIKLYNLKEEVK